MDKIKESIIKISDEILNKLLEFRNQNPEFTFSMRSRDFNSSSEKRLEMGQWFQGSDYIYVGLFNKGDSTRKVKTIGFVITFNSDGGIHDNYIEISFKGGSNTSQEINFHKDLARELNVNLNENNVGFLSYDNTTYINNLKDYVTRVYPLALGLLNKYELTDDYIVSELKFNKMLDRIMKIKKSPKEELKSEELIDFPLNTILYGPPGTGKTYNTINKALAIIERENNESENRNVIKERFNELLIKDWESPKGQIGFITFHQSMSYEDFIEGIKPLKPNLDDKFIKYDIVDGIFKEICALAQSNYENSKDENVKKMSFKEAFQCLKDELEDNPELPFPLKTKGYEYTITEISNTSIHFKKKSGGTGHSLSINTLKEQYYGKEYNFKQGVGIYYPAILAKLNSYNDDSKKISSELLNYVLIIDEINRGNVSQIFGELITLIEPSKRIGETESLEVVLPYSKERFSVPPNLYIIGTMNTADRSIESLDTALRRRFVFEHLFPQSELLVFPLMLSRISNKYFNYKWKDEEWINAESDFLELFEAKIIDRVLYEKVLEEVYDDESIIDVINKIVTYDGIELNLMLEVINKRIELLLDRDYQIGHSYFMEIFSIDDLQLTFKDKIIPLLEEYFYGDYGKIGLVLGNSFIEKVNPDEVKFASFSGLDEDYKTDIRSKSLYKIRPIEDWDFKSIYID